MIQGEIINNRPLAPIVVGWQQGVQELLALVDTGFTGDLKISKERALELGLKTTHVETVSLGNDQDVPMWASLAIVGMEGVAQTVNVLVDAGEPIIGVNLMRRFGYVLTMDIPHDSLVLQKPNG